MKNYKERFYFTAKGLPEVKFHVVRFTGTEKLNEGYSFKILLLTKGHSVNPLDLIGNISIFSISGTKGKRAVYAGRCSGVTHEDTINGYSYISVEFLPLINVLDMLIQSKIYLDKTLSDLIKEIMSSAAYAPIEYEICFSQKHPAQEFSMQYNESNYNYLRYKLEEQGSYFFYGGSGEKIIFSDNPQAHAKSLGILRYTPQSGMNPKDEEEILTSFKATVRAVPGKVVVRNYDWKDPNKMIVGIKDTIKEASKLTSAVFCEEAVSSQDDADRIAALRAEQFFCQRYSVQGKSYASYLRAGSVFTVAHHPNREFNKNFMITEITHEGSQEGYLSQLLGFPVMSEAAGRDSYHNSFSCIKADLAYHPERNAPRAVISGVINAFIDGDDAKAPVLDKYGRYKVIFPFDLSGRSAGKASCWVRRVQEQVGKDSGMSFPLLAGTEVAISFISGNPDRPVITGALSNGETGSLAGPGNKNFSGIRTPGGAQLTFDNDHNGISLIGSGGSGIKLGSGSMSYLQSDTHVALDLAAQSCSSIAGYFQNSLSGFKQTTAAVSGMWQMYLFGILSLLLNQGTNILNSLASSSADAETSNDLSWGASGTKMAASLVDFGLQVFMAKAIPQAEYNVQIMAAKSMALNITQCFPSTAELVANIVIMLLGSLGEAGTTIADGVNTSNDADSQDTGDVEAYKNKLLEAMRAVYDRKSYIPTSDFEKFKYQETTTTVQNDDGTFSTSTVPVGEYYSGAQSSPCAYYAVTTEALSSIISAVTTQIHDIEEVITDLQIKLTDGETSEENRTMLMEDLNQELTNSQQKKEELESLKNLSADLDAQYNNSCVGSETAADYYKYEKQEAVRNTITNSLSALLPEIGTLITIGIWMNKLKNKNIGGVFINAADKNINLHAATYIGHHAGRGIYLNTLETAIIPNKIDQCSNWGSPLIEPSNDKADNNIAKIFEEIKDETLPQDTKHNTITSFLKDGHKNGRKSGKDGKWGDTIDMPKEQPPVTTFIAARTNLSYTKATFEFHYLNQQYKVVTPKYMLTTTLDSNQNKKTTLEVDDSSVELDSKFIYLESSKESSMLYQLYLSPTVSSLGIPYHTDDKALHGIAITDQHVSVTQKKTGTTSSLVLEDNKATLAIGEDNHLTLDGSGKKAVLTAPNVQIAGLVFTDAQISNATGGNIVFGDNDIKISGVSKADKVKSSFADTLKSIAGVVEQAKKDEEKE